MLTARPMARGGLGAAKQHGFSLVELAIVILIMGLLLGSLLGPLSEQRNNARLRNAEEQLATIEDAILGFALANGRLPCPATPASNGLASPTAGGCTAAHGFVPALTLGLPGARNGDNLLLDPWSSPVRYSVSAADVDGDSQWDFVVSGEMRDVTMPSLAPDLVVCTTSLGSTAAGCVDAASTLTGSAPFVLYSLGQDWGSSPGVEQQENLGANVGGGPSGVTYRIASDRVFVRRSRSVQSGNEYDDVVVWQSSLGLYRHLTQGGHLP